MANIFREFHPQTLYDPPSRRKFAYFHSENEKDLILSCAVDYFSVGTEICEDLDTGKISKSDETTIMGIEITDYGFEVHEEANNFMGYGDGTKECIDNFKQEAKKIIDEKKQREKKEAKDGKSAK